MLVRGFQKYDNFVFDLDGTIWYWDKLIPGVKEAIEYLKKIGKNVFYLTNNTVFGPGGFAKKLCSLGLDTDVSKVTCASEFILFYLKENNIKNVVVIGENGLKDFLKGNGIVVTENPDCVVIAQEVEPDEEAMRTAIEMISRGIPAIGSARGRAWHMGDIFKTGVGVTIEKIEEATGKKVKIVGKPSQLSIDYVRSKYKFNPEKTILFGDELTSDIVFANRSGWDSAFVLTGRDKIEQVEEMKEEDKPDFILESLNEILE